MNRKKAFTLIELMIVVAIIGILAYVVTNKTGDLIRKSREGSTKGSLGAIRSALAIYYADNLDHYPTGPATNNSSLLQSALVDKYLKEFPSIRAFPFHPETNAVDDVDSGDLVTSHPTDNGQWVYVSENVTGSWGSIGVGCFHLDSRSTPWSSY